MSNSEDYWSSFFKEFERRRNQYSCVEVKGIIHLEGNTWKNVVTKFYPKPDLVYDKPITYDYGKIIIFSRSIEVKESIEVFKKLKNEKKISLPELKEYEAPTNDLTRDKFLRHEVFNSNKELGGFVLEWPSIVYFTNTANISNSLLDESLISPDLPLYPSIKQAINKDVGVDANSWFGKIVIIVPDYRARIKKLTFSSKSKIKVELEVKQENLENLLCKYYCVSEKEKIYQNDIRFKNPEEDVIFEDEINEFYFYLITNQGEIIDYKEGTYELSLLFSTPGIEIKSGPGDIKTMVEKGENSHVEFKKNIPKIKEFVESVSAFSNSEGGIILIGVDDNRKIVGVQQKDIATHFKSLNEQGVRQWFYNVIRDTCEPTPKITDNDIKIIEVDGKKIVWIKVPAGKDKPYFVKGIGPYIRAGSSDRIMTRLELERIYNEKGKHEGKTLQEIIDRK